MFTDLITAGAFLLFVVVAFLLGDLLFGRGSRRRVTTGYVPTAAPPPATSAAYNNWFAGLLAGIVPQLPLEIDGIRRDLTRAGFYSPGALREYLATRNGLLLMIGAFTAALAYSAAENLALQRTIITVGWITAAFGYGLPRLVLRLQANRRVSRIQTGLPDALDVITMCLTGGLPLQESLSRVTDELQFAHPEIAVELEIVRKQADANTLSHALKLFANRIDLPDIRSMAALVGQTERLGTNVATAVREFADSLRRSYRHRAEERANQASIKLLFPVVLCLAPPVYILLCGPSLMQLREFVNNENRPGGLLSPTAADAYRGGINAPAAGETDGGTSSPARPATLSPTSAVGNEISGTGSGAAAGS